MFKKFVIAALIASGFLMAYIEHNGKGKVETGYKSKIEEITKEKDKYKLSLESIEAATESEDSDNKSGAERKEMLEKFADQLVNFSSIDERNKEIRGFLTDEAIKNLSIDVKVNAAFESTGSVKDIYVSSNDEDHYIIFGSDVSRGAENDFIINVYLKGNKINDFLIQYIELR